MKKILIALIILLVASTANAWMLVCNQDPMHDTYEITGINGTVIPVDAVDHQLKYVLDGLAPGLYKVQVRAYNVVGDAWSEWSTPFLFTSLDDGSFTEFGGVSVPTGLKIQP